jgi:hypothetical protein
MVSETAKISEIEVHRPRSLDYTTVEKEREVREVKAPCVCQHHFDGSSQRVHAAARRLHFALQAVACPCREQWTGRHNTNNGSLLCTSLGGTRMTRNYQENKKTIRVMRREEEFLSFPDFWNASRKP